MENLQDLQKRIDNKFATVSLLPSAQILLCTLKVEYVPIENFQALFTEIGGIIKAERVKKMIFDKRSLKTFHQPSMTWYHTIWKEEMYLCGLKSYRKLLPNDTLFRKSVEIGREKIMRENPSFNFEKFDIVYCEKLEEAFEK
jgi:hypothetical protein